MPVPDALLVACGGGAGAVARWTLGTAIGGRSEVGGFPVGTWVVNVAGCLAIGVAQACAERFGWHPGWRLAATTGFLGGFTTFSAFGAETVGLWESGRAGVACGYVAASIVCGIAAVAVGRYLAGSFGAR